MPEPAGRTARWAFTLRKAPQFELQSPWSEEIDPRRTGCRTIFNSVDLAHDAHIPRAEECERQLDVIDIKAEMMSADIAVLRRRAALIRSGILEYFEIRPVPAT